MNEGKFKKIISFVVFMFMILYVFSKLTYMYREVNNNRLRAAGIRCDNYDIVYIGGSEVYTYWQPMRVWQDKGWTSIAYATDGIPYETVINMIKEAQKYQNPDLYVISLRNIVNLTYDRGEGYLRNVSDSMGLFSANRIEACNNYIKYRDTAEIDNLSLYMDFFKYHTKYKNPLALESSWELADNKYSLDYMRGYEWNDGFTDFDDPDPEISLISEPLTKEQRMILTEILEYLQSNNINAIFVVNPYYEEKIPISLYSEAGILVKEYGYEFLNLNEYYEEMEWDFHKDLKDCYHANCYGAERFTIYLENFIDEKYFINDHRDEEEYQDWNIDSQFFFDEEEKHKDIVNQKREDSK